MMCACMMIQKKVDFERKKEVIVALCKKEAQKVLTSENECV